MLYRYTVKKKTLRHTFEAAQSRYLNAVLLHVISERPSQFVKKFKSSLYSLYYAEVCDEFAGSISTLLRPWAAEQDS